MNPESPREPMTVAQILERTRPFVRENFLITRHLRDHLSLMLDQQRGPGGDRIELT